MLRHPPGTEDLRRAADELASRLPSALAPFARLAFNYRWSWALGGDELFAAIDAHRWEACGRNPLRLLEEAPMVSLERAAGDRELIGRAYSLEESIRDELARTPDGNRGDPEHPVAFLCAEYGVHVSLPVYAGGLGVLAGDLLKAASDMGLPLVAIGLLYRQGYFRQRFDESGWQHEYWVDVDPPRLPGAIVTRDGTDPLVIHVPIRGRDVAVQMWRFDIGRVPLYLLDTDLPENKPIDRWIASQLYVGDPVARLAQYALLGVGGARALRALGIEPEVLHLNEGHPALAPLEWAATRVEGGDSFEEAFESARARTVFTTHTPVPAGNERYPAEDLMRVFGGLDRRLGTGWAEILDLARIQAGNTEDAPGMTALGLRVSRAANGVSERHGEVARSIWRPAFGAGSDHEVPLAHVTNGVHVSTWMAEPVRRLLAEHLGEDWERRKRDPDTWAKIADLPDAELWRVRCELRSRLVEYIRERATLDRLARGEAADYVELAETAFDPDRLTMGFARRLATYKRLNLVSRDLQRALKLIDGPRSLQILLAGKAHPSDDSAKHVVQQLFKARRAPHVGERIAYLHDYDMGMAQWLVSGCDVWVNLPRPPLEASGTSGMKAAMNGALNLSVLDGWWVEAQDDCGGWSLPGDVDADHEAQDDRDAQMLLDTLEKEVLPLFYDRDKDGIPRGWMERVKASIRTSAMRFSAERMLGDYVETTYFPRAKGKGASPKR